MPNDANSKQRATTDDCRRTDDSRTGGDLCHGDLRGTLLLMAQFASSMASSRGTPHYNKKLDTRRVLAVPSQSSLNNGNE
jgi:hypothetical protein